MDWSGNTWRDLELGVTLDWNDALIDWSGAEEALAPAFAAMMALERGAIANSDEGRMVGHYWLRMPEIAPSGLGAEIVRVRELCRDIARDVHREGHHRSLLLLGIGGSALGPQLVADALAEPDDPLRVLCIDNTDPEGIARLVGPLDLEQTLVLCISKSGGTAETRNALAEVQAAYARAEVPFAPNAIAVSGEGSKLWQAAAGWRARVPMWDWVGGRTSLFSAVGLLPAALQGIDIDALVAGAASMDAHTRTSRLETNPAARLAWAWYRLGRAERPRAMVVLPYRDRLVLFSRYLQQLVMESLGKALDRAGREVHEGLAVYGNKGSTDQHAYVQQLRDGPDDHFVTFIVALDDGYHGQEEVEPGVVSGDYLQGFYLGTRRALAESRHPSLSLTLATVDAFRLGALLALYERAVGLYAELVNVNAYHQPGVEAGKKAASVVIAMKPRLLAALGEEPRPVDEICAAAGLRDLAAAHALLSRLAANDAGVVLHAGEAPAADRFARSG
ncbi:MAG: glucose-6-phosphate isomerase [Deltaproteobacteria bacterium]|nr:glucose-6-phosphate isomerase [Deltaproteobacteria bacterium]